MLQFMQNSLGITLHAGWAVQRYRWSACTMHVTKARSHNDGISNEFFAAWSLLCQAAQPPGDADSQNQLDNKWKNNATQVSPGRSATSNWSLSALSSHTLQREPPKGPWLQTTVAAPT